MEALLRSPDGGHVVWEKDGYLIIDVKNLVDLQRVEQIIDDIAKIPGTPEMDDLWDFRGADISLNYHDAMSIVGLMRDMQHQWGHAKTAVLADSFFKVSIAKLVTKSSLFKFDFRVFSDKDEAVAWLKSG